MRVLVGVSGGIAAIKAPQLVRRLRERGHEVRCALTRAAESFVTPLSLEVLSGYPVYDDAYLEANGSGEELHISAAQWAQTLLVVPATAHTLARLSLGLADDFLTTMALAFDGAVFAAPAMHPAMWEKASVQEHVRRLEGRGVTMIGPECGDLASGEVGWGRMAEPETILDVVEESTAGLGTLIGRRVVVSAGPTYEAVDPVRFLGNRSSGKMGFALAAEAARCGADVCLVAGPVSLPTPTGVTRVDVESAVEMKSAVESAVEGADLVIMAAAVSDYRPEHAAAKKLKKETGGLSEIPLVENPDILAGLAKTAAGAIRVGFGAETEGLEDYARAKLERKQAHFLVANDVSRSDIGFSSECNEVTVYGRDESVTLIERCSKAEVARRLFELLIVALDSNGASPSRETADSGASP